VTTTKPTQHPWSSEGLFNKALLYVEDMERYTPDDWQFGLFSSLSLELLARAALAHISPTLLADPRNWRNVHHALGHPPTQKGFTPKSVNAGELLTILNELLPEFSKELVDFCVVHIARRNAELHSGEDAFVGLGTSAWLPKFYASCEVFLRSMGKNLDQLFRDPSGVQELIAAMRDAAAKSVGQEIGVHKKAWELDSGDNQKRAREEANVWASRHAGHRVTCPACGSPALVQGSAQGSVKTLTEEDEIVQKQTMLPSSFECVACGLKISGLSKLAACGLGDAFTATSAFSPAEFFNLHTHEELEEARAIGPEPEFEEDFNENWDEEQ
jgi:transcription elongation factor Elf1